MTKRVPCPPAPKPLEDYAAPFDELFTSLAQRRSFREYLEGLLLPRERNKTLTALAGAEPIVGAQTPTVQRLQFFLSESPWDADAVNACRLARLLGDPATTPHEQGVLVIDDTGDRKAGTKTAHVARQYLGSVGKTDNGIVAVTSLWADERVYFPLHVTPYTPASRLPGGKRDPAFRTKPKLAVELIDAALEAGIAFRAVVADCFYGDNLEFEDTLGAAELPYVLALKPSKGTWAPVEAAHSPEEATEALRWGGPDAPGDWSPVVRRYRDGHEDTWWAAELTFAGYGPDRATRLIVATTDPATLPAQSTWYLATNLPRPGSPQADDSPLVPADLTEVVRLYGLRNWVEQSYKQVKQELGWADFMVRSDRAIRRHWQLVHCAFSFCWQTYFAAESVTEPTALREAAPSPEAVAEDPATDKIAGRGENGDRAGLRRGREGRRREFMAHGAAPGAGLARSLALPAALLAGVVERVPAARTPSLAGRRRRRSPTQPLSPLLTKYR
jgi:SRSO17 transposase